MLGPDPNFFKVLACWDDFVAAREHPRSSLHPVVENSADDGRVAVGGERDGVALAGPNPPILLCDYRFRADQLFLLGPDTAAAREHPRSSLPPVVGRSADDGRVAVGGERDREALAGSIPTYRFRAD